MIIGQNNEKVNPYVRVSRFLWTLVVFLQRLAYLREIVIRVLPRLHEENRRSDVVIQLLFDANQEKGRTEKKQLDLTPILRIGSG